MSARCRRCWLCRLCPTAACGRVPTGSPPGLSGVWLLQEGSRFLQLCQRAKGGSWNGETGKTGGLCAGALLETLWGRAMLWSPHGPVTPTPLPSQQWGDGDLGKVLPNFPLPREFTCGSFFQDLHKNSFLRRSF